MNYKELLADLLKRDFETSWFEFKENWFEVISFDNLALEQLDVKDLMTKDQWEEFYLGDDGIGDEYNSASMYVDMVERKFAKNSCSVERFDLLDTVEDMYQFLKNRKMEK